ncbi:HNH endonuclease [Mucilaginibacter rubeus]|uniref:HNH endonuclease n=1 Tax=Mucilaginibacter rubeus TaxID=2027860 RepID=UPI0016646A1B|nr:HNH endonuclease [Mucilaginibacter rubeus]
MECIFCTKTNTAKSIEHIVSESLGNTTYLMDRGAVCDDCNKKFSNSEREALSSTIFLMERARMGVPSKKGAPASGQLGGFGIQGSQNLVKNLIFLTGLKEEDLVDWDADKKTFTLKLPTFEKNEVAVSKTLLKIGLEALYTSQRKLYKKHDFTELRQFLDNTNRIDWPFIVSDDEVGSFESIPINYQKHQLSKFRCKLLYQETNDKVLLFKFSYGAVAMVINLLNRDLLWMEQYQTNKYDTIYPIHFRTKLERLLRRQTRATD